jgi:carboxypeptidase family protein
VSVSLRGVALCLATAAVAVACGGTGSTLPISPSSPNVARNGTFSGTILNYETNAPVAGVGVLLAGSAGVTDNAGRFTLTNVPSSGVASLTASAPGYVFRGVGFALSTSRTGAVVNLLPDAPPFSLQFYRFFVRNSYEGFGTFQPTHPWTMSPSFYFRTIVDGSGERVPDDTINRIAEIYRKTVPQLTGGKFGVAAVESGDDARPVRDGWINVTFYASLGPIFGTSTVGGNSGTISIRFGMVSTSLTNPFNCFTPEIGIADHEITHSMGFYHTPDVYADTFSGEGCPGTWPDYVRYHAAVMYSRPAGNIDPDVDPSSIANAAAPGDRNRSVVQCVFNKR